MISTFWSTHKKSQSSVFPLNLTIDLTVFKFMCLFGLERATWMTLVSVNLILILNYQVHCGLIALRRLMLNIPLAGAAL